MSKTNLMIPFALIVLQALTSLSQAQQAEQLLLREDNDARLTWLMEEVSYECGNDICCEAGVDCGTGVDCCCAECKKKKDKSNPCATSHKPVFYANDFSYLNDPKYHGNCLGDCLKLNPVGQCGHWGTLDVGGQLRVRYHHEQGMGQDLAGAGTRRFENTSHDFVLTRLRLYTNWKVNDSVRFYFEGIFADASDGESSPRESAS